MESFISTITHYPTAVFTLLLFISIFYWLIALFGLVGVDSLDLDLDLDADVDLGEASNLEGISGLLVSLGLTGVPLTVVITIMAILSWSISFLASYFLSGLMVGWFVYVLGTLILVLTIVATIPLTGACIRPLKPLFKKHHALSQSSLIGRAVKVRSTKVDAQSGEGVLEENGTSLILKIRCENDREIKRGDVVRIVEFNAVNNSYFVVTEEEFGEI